MLELIDLFDSLTQHTTPNAPLAVLLGSLIPSLSTVISYVFLGVALTVLSRATGIGKVWMAWVPFADLYLLGLLADVYTDNRLTTDAERARPRHSPSNLRRKMLGYSIGSGVAEIAASFGSDLCVAGGAMGLSAILSSLVGGEPPAEFSPTVGAMMGIGALIALVAGILCLVFIINLLVVLCPVLNRVFTAVDAPIPALWVVLAIFVPPAASIALFIFAGRQKPTLAERFSPPATPAEDAPQPTPVEGTDG